MHILIVRNNSNSQAIDASLMLAAFFSSQGIEFTVLNATDLGPGGSDLVKAREALASGVHMAVVLGGDGTILRTARFVGSSCVPILGLNFGRLGFLANSSDGGVVAAVASALAGDMVLERRVNLRIDVVCEGECDPWEDELDGIEANVDGDVSSLHTFCALNETAITRGALGRIIDFSLDISGSPIAEMRGDGLVVATATGSTGYALSTGGPLVAPSFEGLVVVPIAPHTLHSRAIVTSASDVVKMDLSNNSIDRAATLFIDGDMMELEAPIRKVYVRRGEEPTLLYRSGDEGFYERVAKVFF